MDEIKKFEHELKHGLDTDKLLSLIQYYEKKQDYTSLETLYQLVLKKEPTNMLTLKRLIRLYMNQLEDADAALFYFKEALDIAPDDPQLHFNYGELMEFRFNDITKAMHHYQRAITYDSKLVNAYLNLAWLYLEKKSDVEEALSIIRNGLKEVEHWELYTQMAYIKYVYQKDYEIALSLCEKASVLSPKNHLILTYMGQIYLFLERKEKAYESFKQALATGKLNPLLIVEMTRLLIMEYKDFNQAIDLLKEGSDYYKNAAIYPAYLANLYANIEQIEEAKYYLQQAESRSEKPQEALLLIGYLKAMLEQDAEDAMMYFEKVVELDPDNLSALSIVGFYNLFNNQQIDLALNYFNRIIELEAPFYPAYFIAAQIYNEHYQDYSKALEIYLKVDELKLSSKERSQLYIIIARLYHHGFKDKFAALNYYEKAYEHHPNQQLREMITAIYEEDKTLVN